MERPEDKLSEHLAIAEKLDIGPDDIDLFVQSLGSETPKMRELRQRLDSAETTEEIEEIIDLCPVGTKVWRSGYRKFINLATDYGTLISIFEPTLPTETREYLLYTLLESFGLEAAPFILKHDEKGGVTSQEVYRRLAATAK
jgi:hypothetical protein